MPEDSEDTQPKWLRKFRNDRSWRLGAVIALSFVLILALAADAWICLQSFPHLWAWGFERNRGLEWEAFLPYTVALLGCFFLFGAVITIPSVPFSGLWQVVSLYFDENEKDFKEKLDTAKQAQLAVEEELKEIEHDDSTGLIQVVKYSRLQLEQYYTIGLRQTKLSFFYSILAMWIGFVMMLAGTLPVIIPSLQPHPAGGQAAGQSFSVSVVVSAGGLVIELISAMFLWMYRSSIGQLTYFYNRQMHLHNILVCFRIAASMKKDDEPKALDAKGLIVEKVLESTWTVERPDAPSSRGLQDMLGGGGVAKTDAAK
jgi:hypothetical protein